MTGPQFVNAASNPSVTRTAIGNAVANTAWARSASAPSPGIAPTGRRLATTGMATWPGVVMRARYGSVPVSIHTTSGRTPAPIQVTKVPGVNATTWPGATIASRNSAIGRAY